MDERRKRQLEIETDAIADGIKRIRNTRKQVPVAKSSTGQAVLRITFDPIVKAIQTAQEAVKRGRRWAWGMALLAIDAEKLALITLDAIINAVATRKRRHPVTLTALARDIGHWCLMEHFADRKRGRVPDLYKLLLGRNKNRWHGQANARKKVDDFHNLDWARSSVDLKLGAALVEMVIEHTRLITKKVVRGKPATLHMPPKALDQVEHLMKIQDFFPASKYRPMTELPRPWTEGVADGGYEALSLPLVKHRNHPPVMTAIQNADLGVVREAVNSIQGTAWRVHEGILALARAVWERGEPKDVLSGVASSGSVDPHDEEADEEDGDSTAERDGVASHRMLAGIQLSIAEEHLGEESIWFPYQLDQRGRAYAVPQNLNPQMNDLGRALIRFTRGKPLGERGAFWLAVQLANLYAKDGVDKLPFDGRVEWVSQNQETIVDSATRPLDGTRLWVKAEKPLRFLAVAKEWAGYVAQGPGFVSHQPIAMDGTCNVLQHLSALGRDPEGGFWTNLVPGPRPQDLYQEVANRLLQRVEELTARGVGMAALWKPCIDRKLVKQATMTTPYGVKSTGIRRQLLDVIAERHAGRFTSEWEAASFIAPHLKATIDDVMVKAAQIGSWLRPVARELAKQGLGVSWVVPTGFPVVNDYRRRVLRRVQTIRNALVLYERPATAKLDTVKQVDSVVANLIHSLDAAHMMLTVRELAARGLADFAMVHDSYAVHACDVDLMQQVLRDQFVRVHTEFTLAGFVEQLKSSAPVVELKQTPDLGALDIEKVRDSQYFFS